MDMDENELKQWVEYANSPLVASRGWAFVPEDRAGWLADHGYAEPLGGDGEGFVRVRPKEAAR